ncbi:MAG: hypothetical protein WBV82_03565 [Myxococcaceae bacterium]
MAVRTILAGIKNKRNVGVQSAQPSQGTTYGKKTLARDDEMALKRERKFEAMMPGPGATEVKRKRRTGASLVGRKKAPSQIGVKRKGGPFKRSRLHGA